MKSIKFIYGLVFVFLLSACASKHQLQESATASDLSLENSLLWEIQKEGYQNSYLFGTIHMIPSADYFFTKEMQAAFDKTGTLALEFDIEEAMGMGSQFDMLQKAFMKDGQTLKNLLSEEDYQFVNDYFNEKGIPLFFLERIKPMFLTIFTQGDDFLGGIGDEMKSYELELVEKAKFKGNKVAGLETMDYQISIFDSIPYDYQAEMLVESIRSMEEQDASQMDTLVQVYKVQDLESLDKLVNSSPEIAEYKDLLIDNRNRNWIPVMAELMKNESVFFAVGAGHLVGEQGIIHLLRKQGFSVSGVDNYISEKSP